MNRGWLALLGCMLVPGLASAQIGPGREAEVLALFAPHTLGSEAVPGWTMENVSIERSQIEVTLQRDAETVELVLRQRGRLSLGPHSEGFSFDGDVDHPAVAAVIDAVRRNDDGTFWNPQGLTEGLPAIAEGLADARHAEDRDEALIGSVASQVTRIRRRSPWTSLGAALLALLVAVGSLFVRRRVATR